MPASSRRPAPQSVRRQRGVTAAKPNVVSVPRPRSAPPSDGTIEVRLVDGRRRPASGIEALVRLFNGRQQLLHQGTHAGPTIQFTGLQVADNLDDRFAVSVAVDGCMMTGFHPVIIRAGETTPVDLMLIPRVRRFDFTDADWDTLSGSDPRLVAFLSNGAADGAAARARYEGLMAEQPKSLACLLNLWTAMAAIQLGGESTPVDFLTQLDWTSQPPKQDRFFCYADPRLVDEVARAAHQGLFEPEPNPQTFHKGATRSWKQVQFGEGNVQLTFHENDTKTIDGVTCVLVEPDIDLFKDLLAHGLLEVLDGQLTDPVQVLLLRWVAGQQAGVAPFNPPYAIVAAEKDGPGTADRQPRRGKARAPKRRARA